MRKNFLPTSLNIPHCSKKMIVATLLLITCKLEILKLNFCFAKLQSPIITPPIKICFYSRTITVIHFYSLLLIWKVVKIWLSLLSLCLWKLLSTPTPSPLLIEIGLCVIWHDVFVFDFVCVCVCACVSVSVSVCVCVCVSEWVCVWGRNFPTLLQIQTNDHKQKVTSISILI